MIDNVVEHLPHVIVEDILQRVPVKSLLRFTSVSRLWKSTIKSQYFESKHLIRAKSQNPDILLCGARFRDVDVDENKYTSYLRTVRLGSLVYENINISFKPYGYYGITESCDGLVCARDLTTFFYVINPATKWFRSLPLAKAQQVNRLRDNLGHEYFEFGCPAFGKDVSTETYKLVWLYNSFDRDLRGPTTCEVFNFNTNTWRYITGPTHRIRHSGCPVHADGSIYWFTANVNGQGTKVLSFDLHTEVFRVTSQNPFIHAYPIDMCSLNNRLCVSEIRGNEQVIWTLTCSNNNAWDKTFSIDLDIVSFWFSGNQLIAPVTVFEQNKLILHDITAIRPGLVVQDTRLNTYCLSFKADFLDKSIPYFPSLLSI